MRLMRNREDETSAAERVRVRDEREEVATETRDASRAERDAERAEVREDVAPVRDDYAPEGSDVRTGVWPTLKRTALEFQEDNMSDWAAALTYYGLLSLFPALIALVSVLGLFADPQTTTRQITDIVTQIGPSSAADTFAGPIHSITSNQSAAGILFVVGLAVALWSASGYVGAFMRASNIVYETPEGRRFRSCGRCRFCVTLAMVIMLARSRSAIVLTGPLVDAVGSRSASATPRSRSGTSPNGRCCSGS